jgi:hypothetical protein
MTHFQIALITGLAAGVLDVVPMLAKGISGRSCIGAFMLYFFAAIIIFYSDLPYLPWWADGMGVTLMMAIPVITGLVGKDRKATPIILLNALIFGALISVAERYIG